MSLIIDGYNVLHVVGIMGRGVGPGSLERSRTALLNFLAETLTEEELARTAVVFDAHDPPAGLPRMMQHRGLTVHFASRDEDADTLIEELIRADSAPRRLTVVSSDHRIQRAAHRRRARAVDSDVWHAEMLRLCQRGRRSPRPARRVRQCRCCLSRLTLGSQFGLKDKDSEEPRGEEDASDAIDPFPPGYADDIEEEPSD